MPASNTKKKTPASRTARSTARAKPRPKASSRKRSRLGRGLDALLGVSARELANEIKHKPRSSAIAVDAATTGKSTSAASGAAARPGAPGKARELTQLVEVNKIVPCPFQPRRHFEPSALEELASSIREHGILQPLVVRRNSEGLWEIVAGERRWRAAQLAKLKKVAVLERKLSDTQAMSIALVENLQRVDLNPVEKARGIFKLQDQSGCGHQEIANLLGCSRVAVTNLLRLLKLNPAVLDMLSTGQLQAGHARALLALDGILQVRCANKIVRDGMSTSAVEKMVREMIQPTPKGSVKNPRDADVLALERGLSDRLGAQVSVRNTRRGGRVVIDCRSPESLEDVVDKLKRTR